MKLRPNGWPLPRPQAIHHIVEDFLTEWDAPISHIQPLRHFLEHCLQTDLRAFYAGNAHINSLSGKKEWYVPTFSVFKFSRETRLRKEVHL